MTGEPGCVRATTDRSQTISDPPTQAEVQSLNDGTVAATTLPNELRAARFGNTYEVGGSNNSRWAIIALIPMWLRNNLPRIRYRAFMKTPNSAVFWGQTDPPCNSLFWWGGTSIRANGGNAVMNGLSIWTGGSPGTQRASLNYTFAPNTWYLFDFDVKMDPANGFVVASVSKADGSDAASMTWNGGDRIDGDANAYYSAWGAQASVHRLSSSVPGQEFALHQAQQVLRISLVGILLTTAAETGDPGPQKGLQPLLKLQARVPHDTDPSCSCYLLRAHTVESRRLPGGQLAHRLHTPISSDRRQDVLPTGVTERLLELDQVGETALGRE